MVKKNGVRFDTVSIKKIQSEDVISFYSRQRVVCLLKNNIVKPK